MLGRSGRGIHHGTRRCDGRFLDHQGSDFFDRIHDKRLVDLVSSGGRLSSWRPDHYQERICIRTLHTRQHATLLTEHEWFSLSFTPATLSIVCPTFQRSSTPEMRGSTQQGQLQLQLHACPRTRRRDRRRAGLCDHDLQMMPRRSSPGPAANNRCRLEGRGGSQGLLGTSWGAPCGQRIKDPCH